MDRLARCLADTPDKPSAASNPSGRGQATLSGAWMQDCPSKHAEGQTTGRSGPNMNKPTSYRERRVHNRKRMSE